MTRLPLLVQLPLLPIPRSGLLKASCDHFTQEFLSRQRQIASGLPSSHELPPVSFCHVIMVHSAIQKLLRRVLHHSIPFTDLLQRNPAVTGDLQIVCSKRLENPNWSPAGKPAVHTAVVQAAETHCQRRGLPENDATGNCMPEDASPLH